MFERAASLSVGNMPIQSRGGKVGIVRARRCGSWGAYARRNRGIHGREVAAKHRRGAFEAQGSNGVQRDSASRAARFFLTNSADRVVLLFVKPIADPPTRWEFETWVDRFSTVKERTFLHVEEESNIRDRSPSTIYRAGGFDVACRESDRGSEEMHGPSR